MLENPGSSPDDIGKVTFVRHEPLAAQTKGDNATDSGQAPSANCDQNHNKQVSDNSYSNHEVLHSNCAGPNLTLKPLCSQGALQI